MSTAFDRVNHWMLFTELIDSGIPLLIIRIIVFWYEMQQLFVQWRGGGAELPVSLQFEMGYDKEIFYILIYFLCA